MVIVFSKEHLSHNFQFRVKFKHYVLSTPHDLFGRGV